MKKGKKILITIVIIIAVIILGCVITYKWIESAGSREHKSIEKVLKGDGSGKKALLVYQPTNTDFAKKIADNLAKGVNEAGYEVTINYPGDFLPKDLSEYNLIVFGSTVYESKYSKVLGEYISSVTNFGDAKVMVYSTGMVPDVRTELDDLSKLIDNGADYLEKFDVNNKETEIKRALEVGQTIDEKL